MCIAPDTSRNGAVRDSSGKLVPPMPQPDSALRIPKAPPPAAPVLLGEGGAKKAANSLRGRQLQIDKAVEDASR